MPFSDVFTFVYEYGITRAFRELEQDLKMKFTFAVTRADETLAMNSYKVQDVMESIRRHDLILIDISGNNPNVLWELGYCQALNKHIIPICQTTNQELITPFNLRGLDVIRYVLSVPGMETLNREIVKKFGALVEKVRSSRSSLRFDPDIEPLTDAIQARLSRIPSNSILRNLAKKEIERLGNRIKSLTQGQFELRNEKPNAEIIEYYCDYLSQLDGDACSFDTVTFHNFWNEITEQGTNWDYLDYNIHAAEKGVRIRRLFLIDQSLGDKSPDKEFLERLSVAFRETVKKKNLGDRIQVKWLGTLAFERDFQRYRNFGILGKGSEWLLFKPNYEHGRMRETKFYYFDERQSDRPELKPHEALLKKYKSVFETAWLDGQIGSEEDLQ
jgi:hypothetical protein